MAVPSEFKQAIDIVDVAERLTTGVQRTADGGMMLCPAHEEKTPSCYLYDDGHFKCFGGGCGAYGDQIELVRLLRGATFGEALDWLAETYNLPRPARDPAVEARERARKVVRETLSAGLAASLDGGIDLPFGLDPDLAARLGLGRALDLAGSLDDIDQSVLSADEIRRWEGAWTVEMHARGGLVGFGALVPESAPRKAASAPAAPAASPPVEDDRFAPEPRDEDDPGDSGDSGDEGDFSDGYGPEDDEGPEEADGGPSAPAAEDAGSAAAAAGAEAPSGRLVFERARSMRSIAFAGLPAARDVISKAGYAIVTPDVSEMLELQASGKAGMRSVVSPGVPLQTPGMAKAIATITGRVVVVVTPERRAERGFAAAMFSFVAEGLRVDLSPRTPDGLAKPRPLSAYLRALAATLDERQQSLLLSAYLRAVPSPSSRLLYQADFRAAGLKA